MSRAPRTTSRKLQNCLPDPVVGIGASAGGLEAFSRLLQSLPADTGMAFVLVQHLDPQHPSLLSHLLAGKTAMPVSEATDGVRGRRRPRLRGPARRGPR